MKAWIFYIIFFTIAAGVGIFASGQGALLFILGVYVGIALTGFHTWKYLP